MSGPKGASYRVETEAERELRQRRAAMARYAAVAAEVAAICSEAQAYRAVYGTSIFEPAAPEALMSNIDASGVEAAADRLQQRVLRERELLRGSVVAATRRQVANLLSGPAPAPPSQLSTTTRRSVDQAVAGDRVPHATAADSDAKRRRQDLADRAARYLAELPATTPVEIRERCAAAVRQIFEVQSESRVRLLLADLAEQIRVERKRAHATEQAKVELARLRAELASVPGHASQQLLDRMDALLAQASPVIPEGLATDVAKAVSAADAERQRREAARAITLALTELDYAVSVGFDTALAADGVGFAAMPQSDGYGIKVLFDAGRPVFRAQVVRAARAGDASTADVEAERAFCANYPTLLQRLARHGLATDQLGGHPPGAVPVLAVADDLVPARQHHEQQQRERKA
jgi:hypothetical protein